MTESIEDLYFEWLCAKVLERNDANYRYLLEMLHGTDFIWVVPADEHRMSDGLELRHEFLSETGDVQTPEFRRKPCSIFEMIIAFSNRASFQTDIPAKDWFWEIITNLGLSEYRQVHKSDVLVIENILYAFTWRIYEPNGTGGMFPMPETLQDQTKNEIWYQFCEYIERRGLF